MEVRQIIQDGYMVKKIGLVFIRLALYKLIGPVNIAFYQSIILLYRRVFIRYEKNLVDGPVGHQVLCGNFVFPDRRYDQSRQINDLSFQVYLL